jgi:hypothetical protein
MDLRPSMTKNKQFGVDEKYFIPGNINLMHEAAVGGFTPKKDNLDWDAAAEDGIVNLCDIRKMASEKNVKPLEVLDGLNDNLTLSGLNESEYSGTAYHESRSTGFCHSNLWACRKKNHRF